MHRRVVLFGHHLKLGLKQFGHLFRFYSRVNERTNSAANEMQQMMVMLHLRIFAEDAAFFWLRDVRLEGKHAVAPGGSQQVVQTLKRILVRLLVVRGPFETGEQALNQVDEDLFWRAHNESPHRGPADREDL